MTSTPGSTPGTPDSAEPDDGDSPAPPQHKTRSDDTAGAGGAADTGTDAGEKGGEGAVESVESAEERGPGTRWAEEQPPPASEGWARWAQPPTLPQQGGRRWGGAHEGKTQGDGPHQDPARHGQPYNGQGARPGTGWGRQGWQPPQAGRQSQPGHPAAWGWTQARPQAPKPGVIPLRPLDMGEMLDGAVASFRRHWRPMLSVTLVVGAITESLDAVVRHQLTDTKALDELQNDPQASFSDTLHVMGSSLTSSGLMLLVTLIGTTLSSALVTIPISRAVLGRELSAGDMRRQARAHLPQVIGLALLIPLIAGVLVGVGSVPGLLVTAVSGSSAGLGLVGLGATAGLGFFVWVYFRLSLSAPALVLEKQGVVAAMKRSWKLVGGSWWRVLGIQVVTMILALMVSMVIQLPFLLIDQATAGDGTSSLFAFDAGTAWANLIPATVGGALSAAITLPLTSGIQTFLYLDQRIRRESLDIELARATATAQS